MIKVYKALVVGSGAAAYSCADWLYREGIEEIAIVTEGRLSGTSRNTGSDKQTYYKISMDGFTADSPYEMAKDMFEGGSCDGEKMYLEALHSRKCFLRLCEYGVAFPTDEFGGYPGYKTDHDNTLRATSSGPLTSKKMTEKLEKVVLEKNRTPILDNKLVIKILTHDNKAYGVTVFDKITNTLENIFAENVICATGAPACVYEASVYPESQHGMTGVLVDSGVRLCNFTQWQYGMASVDFRWNVSGSFMQVVPRFVSADENGEEREFFSSYFDDINEAYSLVFLKGYQWPFSYGKMNGSSRIDIAVHNEILKGRKVYLDYRKNPESFDFAKLCDEAKEYLTVTEALADTPIERLRKLNSKAIDVYLRQGIDLTSETLRVAVCAQHNNGGVYTDRNFQSDIDGLYVIGEASGTFGLVRPGGSALNDTQISGLVCAKHIKTKCFEKLDESILETFDIIDTSVFLTDKNIDYSYFKKKMSQVASFKRDYEGCIRLLREINDVVSSYPFRHRSLYDYFLDRDMLICMKALLEAMVYELPDTGSRGGAVVEKDGAVVEENSYYRDYMTVTGNGKIEYIKVSPVPYGHKPFELFLNEIDESEVNIKNLNQI